MCAARKRGLRAKSVFSNACGAVFDNYAAVVTVKKQRVKISVWDIAQRDGAMNPRRTLQFFPDTSVRLTDRHLTWCCGVVLRHDSI